MHIEIYCESPKHTGTVLFFAVAVVIVAYTLSE